MSPLTRPYADEFASFYAGYVAQIADGVDPIALIRSQPETVRALLAPVSEAKAAARYAPGKWSMKEVVGHIADTERVFSYRLLRIARGDETPLQGFDQEIYVAAGGFDSRPLRALVDDFIAARAATISLIAGLDADAWSRRGVASGHTVSARALAYIIAGHVEHHLGVLRARYGVGAAA